MSNLCCITILDIKSFYYFHLLTYAGLKGPLIPLKKTGTLHLWWASHMPSMPYCMSTFSFLHFSLCWPLTTFDHHHKLLICWLSQVQPDTCINILKLLILEILHVLRFSHFDLCWPLTPRPTTGPCTHYGQAIFEILHLRTYLLDIRSNFSMCLHVTVNKLKHQTHIDYTQTYILSHMPTWFHQTH